MHNRLIQYSALALAFIAKNEEADAQIIFTDINPDDSLFFSAGLPLEIDMNDDGTDDVTIHVSSYNKGSGYEHFYGAWIEAGENISFATNIVPAFTLFGEYSTYCYYPPENAVQKLETGVNVNDALNWGTVQLLFDEVQCGEYGDIGQRGLNWAGDYSFIGVKYTGSESFFGWIRLRADNVDALLIDSYAVTETPDDSISTFLPQADTARAVTLLNDTATGTTTDLHVSFLKAANEVTVSEYRILITEFYDVEDLTVDVASLVSSANYVSIMPTGADVEIYLPENFHTWNDEEIITGKYYHAVVLSLHNTPNSFLNNLSVPSPLLNYTHVEAGAISDLMLDDAADNGNASDMRITFDKAIDENTVSEYRVILIPEEDIYLINTVNAGALDASKYYSILPGGTDIEVYLPATQKDWNGNEIQEGITYYAFVLSTANNPFSEVNRLTGPSNNLTLFTGAELNNETLSNNLFIYYSAGNLYIENDETITGLLKIFNERGALIYQQFMNSACTYLPVQFPAGLYFLKLENEKNEFVRKIVID